MSDATYRIDVEHDPHSDRLPWRARIIRLSDEMLVWIVDDAPAPEVALQRSREWVARDTAVREAGLSVYVDDEGEPVEQHSVKA